MTAKSYWRGHEIVCGKDDLWYYPEAKVEYK